MLPPPRRIIIFCMKIMGFLLIASFISLRIVAAASGVVNGAAAFVTRNEFRMGDNRRSRVDVGDDIDHVALESAINALVDEDGQKRAIYLSVEGAQKYASHTTISVLSTTAMMTVQVGTIVDGTANSTHCSTSSQLPNCNLRSAWAKCVEAITAALGTCTRPLSCAIVLPAGNTSTMNQALYGGELYLEIPSSSTSTAACNVTLSITSSSTQQQAIVRGDGTTNRLLHVVNSQPLKGNGYTPTSVYVHLRDLVITRFGLMNISMVDSQYRHGDDGGSIRMERVYGVSLDRVTVGPDNRGMNGGAMSITDSNYLLVNNSQFLNNSGIDGGAVQAKFVRFASIENTQFVGNVAVRGSTMGGGAVCLKVVSVLRLIHSQFITNTAFGYVSKDYSTNAAYGGGGMYVSVSNAVYVSGCTFQSNKFDQIFEVLQKIEGPFGGGMFIGYTTAVTVSRSTFRGNYVACFGGGMFFGDDVIRIEVLYSTFTENIANRFFLEWSATDLNGGAGFSTGCVTSFLAKGCIFEGNDGGPAGGGGSFGGAAMCPLILGSSSVIEDSIFRNNLGGGVVVNTANALTVRNCSFERNLGYAGAGLKILTVPVFLITGCSFVDNVGLQGLHGELSSGGAVLVDDSYLSKLPQETINALAVTGTDMRIELCTFTSNVADNGGAIAGSTVTSMIVSGCAFTGNSANIDGGAIVFHLSTKLTLHRSTFVGNVAVAGDGGAVQFGDSCSHVSIHECAFKANTATLTGGAVSFKTNIAYVSVIYSNFTQNRALNESGGAIYFSQSCSYISIGGLMPVIREATQNYENRVYDSTLFAYPVEKFILTFDVNSVVSCSTDFVMVGKQDGFTRTNGGDGDLIFPRKYPEDAKFDGYTDDGAFKEDINATDSLWRRERARVNFIGGSLITDYSKFGYNYHANTGDGTYRCRKGYNDAQDWPGINGNDPFIVAGVYTTIVSIIVSDVGYIKLALFPVPQVSKHASLFVGNTAGKDGGALFFNSQNENIFIMRGTEFRNNKAGGGGGAVGFDFLNGYIYMYSVKFLGNRAGTTGGALSLSKMNFPLVSYDAYFESNTARDGGAVFLGDGNGNGLVKSITPSVVVFRRTVMKSNHAARHGGGLYLANINALRFEGVVVTNSTASSGSGGWAYLDSKNYLLLDRATVVHSTAHVSGGAMFAFIQNSVNFSGNCSITSSRSMSDGGAVRLQLENSLTSFGRMNLSYNLCTGVDCSGGALSASSASSVAFLGPTTVAANVASLVGGGVVMYDSGLHLGPAGVVFSENIAVEGSALHLGSSSTSTVVIDDGRTVVNNTLSPMTLPSIQFVRNHCTRHGGTVSWIKDPSVDHHPTELFSGRTPGYSRVQWIDNTAPFGRSIMTQPTFLNVSTSSIPILSYDNIGIRPIPRLNLFDQFGNQNYSDYTSIVSVTVKAANCSGKFAYVSGTTSDHVRAGAVAFANLTAFCTPGGSMTIQYAVHYNELPYNLYATTTLYFRDCVAGEVLADNQCQVCPSGSYSLKYSPKAACQSCPDNSNGCSGNKLDLKAGYWRISPLSYTVLTCPFPDACVGGVMYTGGWGNSSSSASGSASVSLTTAAVTAATAAATAGDGSGAERQLATSPISLLPTSKYDAYLVMATFGCLEGHQGPLCAVCKKDYYFSATLNKCMTCEGQRTTQLALLVCIPIIMMAVMLVVVFSQVRAKKKDKASKNKPSMSKRALACVYRGSVCISALGRGGSQQQPHGAPLTDEEKAEVEDKMNIFAENMQRILMPKVKILLTASQIVSGIPTALDLHFPSGSSKLLRGLSFVNFSSLQLGSPQCYSKFDYVDTLIMQTLTPLGIICLLLMAFTVHYNSVRKGRRQKRQRVEILRKYTMLVFFITFLILPAVTTTIFGTFPCVNIDLDKVLFNQPTLMRRSYDIECTSSRYRLGWTWAIVMIVVYPIGVTSLYLYVLYYNRFGIMVESGFDLDKLWEDNNAPKASFLSLFSTIWYSIRGNKPAKVYLEGEEKYVTMRQSASVRQPSAHEADSGSGSSSGNGNGSGADAGAGAGSGSGVGNQTAGGSHGRGAGYGSTPTVPTTPTAPTSQTYAGAIPTTAGAAVATTAVGTPEVDEAEAVRLDELYANHPYVIASQRPRTGIMKHITPVEIRFLWRMYKPKYW